MDRKRERRRTPKHIPVIVSISDAMIGKIICLVSKANEYVCSNYIVLTSLTFIRNRMSIAFSPMPWTNISAIEVICFRRCCKLPTRQRIGPWPRRTPAIIYDLRIRSCYFVWLVNLSLNERLHHQHQHQMLQVFHHPKVEITKDNNAI